MNQAHIESKKRNRCRRLLAKAAAAKIISETKQRKAEAIAPTDEGRAQILRSQSYEASIRESMLLRRVGDMM